MISDPDWWLVFDYKLTLAVAVISALITVVGVIMALKYLID